MRILKKIRRKRWKKKHKDKECIHKPKSLNKLFILRGKRHALIKSIGCFIISLGKSNNFFFKCRFSEKDAILKKSWEHASNKRNAAPSR